MQGRVAGRKPRVGHTEGKVARRCSGDKIATRTHTRKFSGGICPRHVAATRLSVCGKELVIRNSIC